MHARDDARTGGLIRTLRCVHVGSQWAAHRIGPRGDYFVRVDDPVQPAGARWKPEVVLADYTDDREYVWHQMERYVREGVPLGAPYSAGEVW